jgi:quercetin dioxygenase-like cupin family protein
VSSRKLVYAVLFACFALASARAQDAIKVEPMHYKLDFENEHVQVVHVHYGPHERSALHEHPGGVVIYLTGGHLRFTDENGNVREVFAKAGEVRWFPPFKHRVENLGDQPYNAVYVGLRNKAIASKNADPMQQPSEAEAAEIIAKYIAASGTTR